jgi:hypothetical protein
MQGRQKQTSMCRIAQGRQGKQSCFSLSFFKATKKPKL